MTASLIKSPGFSILADLSHVVVWIVSARPPISNSFSPFIKPLRIVSSAPFTTGITCSIVFSYFSGKVQVLVSLFVFFGFHSTGMAKSTIRQVLSFLLIITRPVSLRLGDVCTWKFLMSFSLSFTRWPSKLGRVLQNTSTATVPRGKTPTTSGPVGWGCRIHWLLLWDSPNECLRYDIKQSAGEAPVMQGLWGMRSIPPLPSIPGPLWPGMIATDRVSSMGQIELNSN